MRLKEFQFLVKEMWDRLEERGVRVKRILPEDSVEENTSEKKEYFRRQAGHHWCHIHAPQDKPQGKVAKGKAAKG